MLDQETYTQFIYGLKQQLWFFGQDIEIAKENLLEQYGFHRYRTPGHGGSSRYRVEWQGRTVDLHSFCAGIYGSNQDGFLFVRAHSHAYVYLEKEPPLPGVYPKANLVPPSVKKSRRSFFDASCRFLEWLEHYENWVDTTYGKEYREDCYHRYHKKWLPPDQARTWFETYRNSGPRSRSFFSSLFGG